MPPRRAPQYTDDEIEEMVANFVLSVLSDEDIISILREAGWDEEDVEDVIERERPQSGVEYDLSDVVPNSWDSGVFSLVDKSTWPTPAQIMSGPSSDVYKDHGVLRVSYDLGSTWTIFTDDSGDSSVWVWPSMERFYRTLTRLSKRVGGFSRGDRVYDIVMLEWVPLPEAKAFRMFDAVVGNCAILMLQKKYAKSADALQKVELAEDGAFTAKQMWDVAFILKRNAQVVNRLGAVLDETKKDGKWRYGTSKSPVTIINYDGHALDRMPDRPILGKDDIEVRVVDKVPDWRSLRLEHGLDSVVWPVAEGFLIRSEEGSVLYREKGVFDLVQARAAELGVEQYQMISKPFGVEYQAWTEINKFRPTPALFRDLWRSSEFYPVPFSRPGGEYGSVRDMNQAYEAAPGTLSKDLYDRWGFPSEIGQYAIDSPPVEILQETGLVVAVLDLSKCHPWVVHQVRGVPRGVFTTMRLAVWIECGAAVIVRIEHAVIATKYYPSAERLPGARYTPDSRVPDHGLLRAADDPKRDRNNGEKRWGRDAIGRLVPSESTHPLWIYCEDDSDASSIIRTLNDRGQLITFDKVAPYYGGATDIDSIIDMEDIEETRGYWKIGYSAGPPKSACYHAHAYYLDYAGLAVDREVFRHPWESVMRIATDSIALAPGEEFSEHVVVGTEMGQWKVEKLANGLQKYPEQAPREVPAYARGGTYWDIAATSVPKLLVLDGPAGWGKSYKVDELVRGNAVTILTPTRRMRRKYVRENRENPNVRVFTWRKALQPGTKFVEAAVSEHLPKSGLVWIAEIGTWGSGAVSAILPWLVERYRVFADGDRFQMAPIKASPPWEFLGAWESSTVVQVDTLPGWKDHRSKEVELAELKARIRGRTNREVRSEMIAQGLLKDYDDFLASWHPRDYVYTCLTSTRKWLSPILAKIHREKYHSHPVRLVYKKSAGELSGEEGLFPLDSNEIPSTTKWSYVTTYSSCQGETAGPDQSGVRPKVWITSPGASEYFANALYVGVTRVEVMSQLALVAHIPFDPWAEKPKKKRARAAPSEGEGR